MTWGDIREMEPDQCRACGELIDCTLSANPITTPGPRVGAWSVCGYCGEVSRFALDALGRVRMREVSLAELAEFNDANPGVVQQIIQFQIDLKKSGQ